MTSRETDNVSPLVQSVSRLAPIGVNAALRASSDPKFTPRPKIFDEFSLKDRVGIVTGGNSGLGLEMALALCEAGARAIYCFDITPEPLKEWTSSQEYVRRMGNGSRLEYVNADVREQKGMWEKVREVGDNEGRMDVCVACAGIVKQPTDCLQVPADEVKEVLDVNVNGVLFTAQAAGQQMLRFGNPGSIVLISSIAGSAALKGDSVIAYHISKSALLQMARSMACELANKNIRVNSLSPGYMLTPLVAAYAGTQTHVLERWSTLNPMGRMGRPDELRGVITWLASDASSFCTGSDIIVSGGHHSW